MGGVTRRRVLIGGGVAVGAGLLAAQADGGLSRWWWRAPWAHRRRPPGLVDYAGAQWAPAAAANHREANRPEDWAIDRVVVHVTQGSFTGALNLFADPSREVSAHYVVRSRDGHVAQTVREIDVAFHAGNWNWNNRSIGIEHEGFVDQPRWFTDAMYRSSARLTAAVCHRYGIPADRTHIVGHYQVPGTDHTDPGPHWEWGHYMDLVRGELARHG
ncbi:N-acetylmuramoyl-L-alanine amidase [Mangrovactinospora gilvigrisea]|uniref:N-acetylmuramoyl-L-alanine amidase n=1 Tax=Mangrovactinospora gilvigrisea TaxID=1428644 RepID=A0A1J7BD80_9ACTN|nr:N-acetylmuramoyl-L-alanine amidase [Mangrovactinospora gilvigrisea]OIV36635.1 N-acetylmuramoyl-L-alanine amidase [Mangrovactinospora gilvigrisea]